MSIPLLVIPLLFRVRFFCLFDLIFLRYVSFTAGFMNQGGALVHVYLDGTVLISHGGTEMGQGLHTKVCQVAANEFGIDVQKVS